MSFADRRGVSLNQILSEYTEAELVYWQAWTRREITDAQKIEHVIANLAVGYFNAHRGKGQPKIEPKDLVYRANWNTPETNDSQTIITEFLRAFK